MNYLKISTLLSLALLLSAGCAAPQMNVASEAERAVAESDFERIKALSGEWYMTGGNRLGKELEPNLDEPFVFYEVSSNGHSVIEKLYYREPGEMTSVYYLDKGHLMMDHYCSLGNQPRMIAISNADDQVDFHLVGVGNMPNKDDLHISSHALEFHDSGELTAHWGATKDRGAVSGSMYLLKKL